MTSPSRRPATAKRSCRLFVYSLTLAALLTACSIIPWNNPATAGTYTSRDLIGPEESPELVGGVVLREVKISVPSNGLTNAEDAAFEIIASTRSSEPFSDVQLVIGDPINDTVTIGRPGNPQWEWPFPVPSDCDDGCVITIPVTVEQVEEGPAPRFGWSANLYFEYTSEESMSDAAHNMTAEIVSASD